MPQPSGTWPTGRRSIAYGVLWSAAFAAGEALSVPSTGRLIDQAAMLGVVFVQSTPTGVAIAWMAFETERRSSPWWIRLTLLLMLAAASSAFHSLFWWMLKGLDFSHPAFVVSHQLPSWSYSLYMLWTSIYHGALFAVVCMLTVRVDHSRANLSDALIERVRSETRLADARLDALRSRINPAFLLRAMDRVQQLYRDAPQSADRLLEQLVGFLRLAMPGLRGFGSTLGHELALASAYAHLCAELEPQVEPWRFNLGVVPDRLPFPPFTLLPVLDAYMPRERPVTPGVVQLRPGIGEHILTIEAPEAPHMAAQLDDDQRYRLQVAVGALFGKRAAVEARMSPAGRPCLRIRLPMLLLPSEPFFFSTAKESAHGSRSHDAPDVHDAWQGARG